MLTRLRAGQRDGRFLKEEPHSIITVAAAMKAR